MTSTSSLTDDEKGHLFDGGVNVWSTETFEFLSCLSSDAGNLSNTQLDTGELYLKLFLNSRSTDYSLLNGKSGLITVISFYIFNLPTEERAERVDKMVEKVLSERSLLLTESAYNDLSTGRIGFIVSLGLLYSVSCDLRIRDLVDEIYTLFVKDILFFKGGITWMFSDLRKEDVYNPGNNLEIFLALLLVNRVCETRFADILLKNIVFEKNGHLIYRKICSKGTPKFFLRRYGNGDPTKGDINLGKLHKVYYQNSSARTDEIFRLFYFFWNSPVLGILKPDACCVLLSPEQSLYILIKANFPACSDLVIENLLYTIKTYNYSLRINDILGFLTKIAISENNTSLIYGAKLSKFNARLIGKSPVFYKSFGKKSLNDFDIKTLSDLDVESFLDVKFSINRVDFSFEVFSSTWVFEPVYKRKKIVGCFKICRFDKDVFVDSSMLDGILINIFSYIGFDKKSIRDFMENGSSMHSINYSHLKSRILYLVHQGVFIPFISS